MKCPILYAINNRGVHGLENCFGAPFIAKDFEQAKEMVKLAIEKEKDCLDLDNFFLVEICPYDLTAPLPLVLDKVEEGRVVCVAFLFEDEESEVADEQE